ncbi:uncharacterized protein G2W53_009823 [Senna tora]|uniref:Uncharacterized protein n=1 Tax=Senna tora TaxID=362788 RepID=A0A834WZ17_9FABA|nr:uncharacterized protein G2W53_009823 [Senna tora]
MPRLESSWRGRSVDHVLTYSRKKITVSSKKPSRITRQKTCCASDSNTSVRVVFRNRSGFDAPIGVVLAWEERGSYQNIFQMKNHGRISETFTNYEANDLLRKNLHELRGKRLVAQVSQTRRFANQSGFDAPIGVVSAWGERGSCLNIFRMKNRGRISETFTNYEAKTCCASESNTSVRVVFANRSGFDAPIGVVLAWEERGPCLNIFRMTNRGRISETITNYEAKDLLCKNLHELRGKRRVAQVSQTRRFSLYSRTRVVLMLRLESSRHGRSVDHVLTYSGRQIAVGSQKPSRITRQRTCCASESNTSVVLMLRLGSSWNGRSVDHVLTYAGRQIAVGSQRPSRITRQKTCCASESNMSVREPEWF